MKILRAPNDSTVTRVTSVGEVKFVEGIATEFTPEQAEFFTQTQRNYTVEDITTDEEAATAKAAAAKAAADKAASARAEEIERKTAAERESATSEFLLKIDDASFAEVRAFAKANGIKAGGSKADIIDRIGLSVAPPDGVDVNPSEDTDDQSTSELPPVEDDPDEMADIETADHSELVKCASQIGMEVDKNLSTEALRAALLEVHNQSTSEAGTTSEEEPAAEITEVDETVDLNEADHATLVEIAEQYGVAVKEEWSTEELRAAMLADEGIQEAMETVEEAGEEETPPDAPNEETAKSDETTEAAQDASEGAQSAPAATSADPGTGAAETTGKVKLPTARDNREVVAQWCRDNDVDDKGTKAELLLRIYADERFKK